MTMTDFYPRDYKVSADRHEAGGMTIEPGRLRRAIHLDATPNDINSYMVTGGSMAHTVTVVDGECRCDCIDASVRGAGCKHELAVRLSAAGDPEILEALRGLVPLVEKVA